MIRLLIVVSLIGCCLLCASDIQAQTTTWGTNNSRTETRSNAGDQGTGVMSGFYEYSAAETSGSNYPAGATSWWHLLDVRHNNPANNYAMQFSGSFFDQSLWFRKTSDNPSQPWSRVITEINNNATIGDGQGASSLKLSDISGAGYLINTGGYALNIQKHMGGTTWISRFTINMDGNIGIGITNPQTKLAVNGDISSKKVKVTQTGWPDYVFDSNYQLPSLKEIEAYVKINKHLPDVTSAKEVEEKGLDLGENQAAILKKVEELTLYIIQQQKEIDELKKEIRTGKN